MANIFPEFKSAKIFSEAVWNTSVSWGHTAQHAGKQRYYNHFYPELPLQCVVPVQLIHYEK